MRADVESARDGFGTWEATALAEKARAANDLMTCMSFPFEFWLNRRTIGLREFREALWKGSRVGGGRRHLQAPAWRVFQSSGKRSLVRRLSAGPPAGTTRRTRRTSPRCGNNGDLSHFARCGISRCSHLSRASPRCSTKRPGQECQGPPRQGEASDERKTRVGASSPSTFKVLPPVRKAKRVVAQFVTLLMISH